MNMANIIYNISKPIALLFIIFFTAVNPLNSATVINLDVPGVTGTKHNLSMYGPGSVQAKSTTEICVFCHTPHSSQPSAALWNKNYSATTYTIYGTATLTINNTMGQPTGSSRLCLSCHDGTIAIGSLLNAPGAVLAQTLEMQGVDSGTGALTETSAANIGIDISNDHPVSFSYSSSYPANVEIKDPGENNVNLSPAVLKSGRMECASCHDPHSSAYPKFLRAALNPATNEYGAQLCNLCHNKEYWSDTYEPVHREDSTFTWTGYITADPNPWEPHDLGAAVPATTISGSVNAAAVTIPVTSIVGFPSTGRIRVINELIDYTGTTSESFTGATRGAAGTTAMDYTTGATVTGSDYSDDTLKMHGCLSCHRSHGGAVGKQLLKGRDNDDVNQAMVGEEWTCLNCHDGSMTNGTDSIKNIEAVLDLDTSANKHNTKGVYGMHKSERFATGTPAVRESPTNMDTNRHTECQDCHNTHDLKGGNHTVGGLYGVTSGNRIGNNLIGAWGVKPTSWPSADTSPSGPDGYATLKLTDPATSLSFESYICIKCHSSYAYENAPLQLSDKFPNSIGYESDPVADFNINNNGFHPVFENAGKNQPGIGDNPNWTDPYGLGLSNTFKCATEGTGDCASGVQYTSTMTCSDCHGNSNFTATDPKGPHGSANKYIMRSNETGTGSTKNFCYNCHRRDVYGDEGFCPPSANYSRVSHPPDEGTACIGAPTSPFYKTGTNLGNASNKFGILCISCHGGGEKTQNGNSVIDGIHGSHTGIGGNGNYGADELGKRLMNGACVVGHTHATKILVAGVTLWFKPDLTSDKVCNYNASTNAYAPYAETTCAAAGDEDGDGFDNDGCPSVGAAPETDGECTGIEDEDLDGAINDGCPAIAVGNAANYDYWPAPWP